MIPAISEINFPSYATLHQATVTLADMGDRTISSQVKIDGDIVPSFDGWELRFKGERFVLQNSIPPATKDNSSRCSFAELTFYSWPIQELKRYYFVQMASTDPTNPNADIVADKYEASLRLNLEDFVAAFNKVLDHYFDGQIVMDLYDAEYPEDVKEVSISHNKIWEVLTESMYEQYGVRWYIEYDETDSKYHIKVGYPAEEVSHIFQYGYDGGLLKFERQVPDDEIKNIILGRGGDKNLPYRYFKRQDPNNHEWAADPDAIPELENIYFDRLRDINFRYYVRGWKTNPDRDLSWSGTVVEPYDPSTVPEAYRFAYVKGHEDAQFNPVEYVKDDDSIQRYGEHWGYRDDDDEIHPTIQGVEDETLGRIDEAVDVSEIITDDVEAAKADASTVSNLQINSSIQRSLTKTYYTHNKYDLTYSASFHVPDGMTGRLSYQFYCAGNDGWGGHTETVNTDNSYIKAVAISGGAEYPSSSIPPGWYYFKAHIELNFYQEYVSVDFGINQLKLHLNAVDSEVWKPTFDVWVKNLWGTTQGQSENDTTYSHRVWDKILGDKVGNEAKLVFSTGAMSVSSDYEFVIADYPVVDRTKTINGVSSEWRITLRKSDAELEATGLWLPNAQSAQPVAGDKFFFTGIDMPFAYVMWAEKKLNTEKQSDIDASNEPKPTWVIGLDKVRAHTLESADLGVLLADKLSTGAQLTIKDKRYTNNEELTLYAQSVTYTWSEGTVMVPEIEVVLSDDVISQTGPIYAIQKQIRALRPVAYTGGTSNLYARKYGGDQQIDAPTAFGSLVKSEDFEQGIVGGKGWGLYRNGDDEAVLEVDRIMARNGIEAASIVANQVSYVGGKQIRSAASIEVDGVEELQDGYKCYFDQRHGSVANLFKVNDIALGQAFDAESNETRTFRRLVTAVDVNSVTLSKTVASGTGVPVTGDTIVQFGNTTDPARQFAIVSDVIGGGYEQMLSGLNSVSASGSEYYFAGTKYTTGTQTVLLLDKDGNPLYDVNDTPLGFTEGTVSTSPRWFVGNAQGEYAEWQNGELTVKGSIIVKNSDGTYSSLDAYKSIKETADYLRAALPADTDGVTLVQGGIVLSNIIGVVRGGDLVAGMNASNQIGYNSSHGTLMVFAGAEDADQVSDAKFRVYEDGHVVANDLVAVNGDSDICVTITGDSIGSGSTTPATNYWPAFSTSKQLSNPGPSGMQQTNEVHSTYSLSTLQSSVSGAGTLTIPQRRISVGIAFSSAYASSEIGRVILTAKLYCNGTVLKTVSTNAAYPGGASTLSLTIPQATADITGSYNLRYELSVSFTSSKANTLTATPSSSSATTVSYSQNTQNVVLGNDGIRVQLSSTAFFMAKMEPSNPTIQMVVGDQTISLGTGGIYFKLGGTTTYKAGVAYNGTNYYMTLTAV